VHHELMHQLNGFEGTLFMTLKTRILFDHRSQEMLSMRLSKRHRSRLRSTRAWEVGPLPQYTEARIVDDSLRAYKYSRFACRVRRMQDR